MRTSSLSPVARPVSASSSFCSSRFLASSARWMRSSWRGLSYGWRLSGSAEDYLVEGVVWTRGGARGAVCWIEDAGGEVVVEICELGVLLEDAGGKRGKHGGFGMYRNRGPRNIGEEIKVYVGVGGNWRGDVGAVGVGDVKLMRIPAGSAKPRLPGNGKTSLTGPPLHPVTPSRAPRYPSTTPRTFLNNEPRNTPHIPHTPPPSPIHARSHQTGSSLRATKTSAPATTRSPATLSPPPPSPRRAATMLLPLPRPPACTRRSRRSSCRSGSSAPRKY